MNITDIRRTNPCFGNISYLLSTFGDSVGFKLKSLVPPPPPSPPVAFVLAVLTVLVCVRTVAEAGYPRSERWTGRRQRHPNRSQKGRWDWDRNASDDLMAPPLPQPVVSSRRFPCTVSGAVGPVPRGSVSRLASGARREKPDAHVFQSQAPPPHYPTTIKMLET